MKRPHDSDTDPVSREMFEQYYRPLCFHARRYLADEEDVKDVVMDAFLNICNRKLSFPNQLALRSFLYTAVHNASMNHLRSASRRSRHYDRLSEQAEMARHEEEYLMDRIEDEVMFRLLSAIEELPPQCSRVFKSSYLEGMNTGQVAALMGIAENTVKAQRARARKLLQEKLRDLYPLLAAIFLG